MTKLNTALAVVHFAGEAETYAFQITGPRDMPTVELDRFMAYLDKRIEDIDPFTLNLMAASIFEGAACEVHGLMDLSLAQVHMLAGKADTSQIRTI